MKKIILILAIINLMAIYEATEKDLEVREKIKEYCSKHVEKIIKKYKYGSKEKNIPNQCDKICHEYKICFENAWDIYLYNKRIANDYGC